MRNSTNLKSLSRVLLGLFSLFCLISSSYFHGQEQIGRPFITNYSYQEYESHPTNWWALEDKDGIMYFANNDGLLQFDGVNWNIIDINDSGARCLVQDDKGTIFVGGGGEIGYLKPTQIG